MATEGVKNVEVNQIAVSNFNGKSKFFVTYGNPGASSLLKPNENWQWGRNINQIEVDVVKLEDWCKEKNIEKIDVMWIDAQGSELNIFEGMGDLLKEVKAIYVECSMIPYYDGARNSDQVIEYLSRFDFELLSETHHTIYEGDFMFMKKIEGKSKKLKYKNPQGFDHIQEKIK
jgi:FkbM family methyltransferase